MKTLILFSFIIFATFLQAQNTSSSTTIPMNSGNPNTHFRFGSIFESGFVSPDQLSKANSVYAFFTDANGKEVKLKVTEYSFIYQPKKGDASIRYNKKSVVGSSIKSILQNVQTGDKIIIGNVKAKTSDGNISVGKSLQLVVK